MIRLTSLQQNRMRLVTIPGARSCIALLCLGAAIFCTIAVQSSQADPTAKEPYPNMAPLGQYLMPRDAEIALARSAGPESVSRDAEVLVLGPHGFETAAAGHNGFVCVVSRSWFSPIDDPQFWNPKERGPICYNAAAARYFIPLLRKKTDLVLGGKSKAAIRVQMRAALDAGEFPAMGAGAMCFMMAKAAYLNDNGGHWHPHLMFFVRSEPAASWGADLPGSPIYSAIDELDHTTTFMVPVQHWSDGTPDAH
jgi:hypothetical protein